MGRRNPGSPWNPAEPVSISPEGYEKQVVAWLRKAGGALDSFAVTHLDHRPGPGGEYEFDAVAEFTVLSGARITLLVECKRSARPVEREDVLALWAKLQEVGAHKALVFATCGFQSGAIEFAQAHGIATITFVSGDFLYETRALGPTPPPPAWANLAKYAGIVLSRSGKTISCSTIDETRLDTLATWLSGPVSNA